MPLDLAGLAGTIAELMTHAVDVERLADPQQAEAWLPVRQAVPCLILPTGSKDQIRGEQFVAVRVSKVIFAAAIESGTTYRYLYTEPGGAVRKLYPDAVRNMAELDACWVVDCEEVL
jgi:hypothetical protein